MGRAEYRLSVPYLDQTAAAPTGCESVSAVMLLRFLGYPVTIPEFIDGFLEKGSFRREGGGEVPCSVFPPVRSGEAQPGPEASGRETVQHGRFPDGTRLIGPDPREAFCGDPYDPDAMGCYAPVIRKALNRFFQAHPAEDGRPRYEAEEETGKPLAELVRENLSGKGLPLLVWCTIDLDDAVEGPYWYLENGTLFTWYSREHCILLSGYGEGTYIIHDPWNHNGILTVERELFEKGWRQQGLQAVSVRRIL